MVFTYFLVISFWKGTLAFVASGYTNLEPLSNLLDSMCIMVLSAVILTTYWCIVFALIYKFVMVAMHINWAKYMSTSIQTWFFVFTSLRVPMDGIACVHTITYMLLNTHACEAYKLVMSCGVPLSSGSDSRCMPSTPLHLASLYLASTMVLPCT